MEKSDNFCIFNGMKGPDLTLILQQQLDVANETNRILLARIDDLGRTIEELRAELSISNLKREELMATVTSMQKALLERDTDLSKQKRINKGLSKLVANKSEKHKPANGTEDVSENNTTTSSSRTDTAYITKERGNNGAKRKEHFNIETVVEEIFPAEKDFDPALASLIKYRDSISYEYIPGKFIKRIRRQYFYSQNGTVYSGKLPAKPLFNSNYDGSFIAGMAQLRYMYTMPVERIVKLFGDNGFDLPKPTAHNLLKKAAALLDNLHKAMRMAVLSDKYLGCDETYAKVLVQETGKNGLHVKKGYVWVAVAHNLGLVYFFYEDGSRKEDVILDFLRNYKGTIQSDGLAAYRKLGEKGFPDIMRLPCLQHIKRKFKDCGKDADAEEIVNLINRLYHNNHLHKIGEDGWTEKKELCFRQKYAPPILDKIQEKLTKITKRPGYIPDSDIYEAVTYMQNEMSDIRNIFTASNYLLDNNAIERVNRCISLMRHNSLFFGSHAGANRAVIYYSLACSCRQRGINFFEYISDIMNRAAILPPTASVESYRELLPDKWHKS
ncbi:IS66 family transposase [Phocaeicola dorei]|uniref:IS66 family transposase n=1 Tax=Phocaeicola dorei TaxID=357276 RepID=UPI0020CABC00|nr:IS66 family transposase [Phocaeicola dorei]